MVHSKILPYGWQSKLEPYASNTRIVDASNRQKQPIGILPLWLRLRQFQARMRFLFVSKMATTCILGTSFIDRFVKAIIPGRRKVVLYHSPVVAIVGSQSPTTYGNAPDTAGDHTKTVSKKLKVVKPLSIPPMTRAPVTLQSDRGLCFLQSNPKMALKQLSLMASGIKDIYPNKPFEVIVANFGHTPFKLARNAIVGLAIESPTGIYTPSSEALRKTGVLQQFKEGGSEEVNPVSTVTNEGILPGQTDKGTWKDQVHIGVQDSAVRKEVFRLLHKFKPMWSGGLGKIVATKHRIDLVEGAKPIPQQPYRAGPTAREHQRKEIDRMLQAGVIEPATSEW